MRSSLFAPLSAVLFTTACGVEIRLPEVCQTLPEQKIAAAPFSIEGTAKQRFEFDVSQKLSEQSLPEGTELRLANLSLTPKAGVEDLSFIKEAKLTLIEAAGTALLAQYAQSDVDQAPRVVSLSGGDEDLAPRLSSGPVALELALTGKAPTVDWTVAVKACLSPTTPLVTQKAE